VVPDSLIVISMMQEVHHATGKDDRFQLSGPLVRDICYKLKVSLALALWVKQLTSCSKRR
jgi:hypothetical protein